MKIEWNGQPTIMRFFQDQDEMRAWVESERRDLLARGFEPLDLEAEPGPAC